LLEHPQQSFRLWSLLVLLLAAGLLITFRGGMTIDTNILSMLPRTERDPVVIEATDRFAQEMNSRIRFMISAETFQACAPAAETLVSILGRASLFETVRVRADASRKAQLAAFYQPFAATLTEDPSTFIDTLTHRGNALEDRDGWRFTRNEQGTHILIDAKVWGDVFSRVDQQRITLFMKDLREELQDKHPQTRLAAEGAILYAAATAGTLEAEASTIGFGSFVAVMLLFALVFRGPRPLVLGTLPILVGLLAAMVVSFAIFDRVHLLTLGFGASLIGICIDYTFHFFCHRLEEREPETTFPREILSSITLGVLTSMMGYLALLAAPFPVLRQMAVFSIVGLSGAFVTVLLAFPWLAAGWRSDGLQAKALANRYLNVWQRLSRTALVSGGLALAVLVTLGLMRIHFDDDFYDLSKIPEDLIRQDRDIARVAGDYDTRRFLLVEGETPARVMTREQALHTRLAAASVQVASLSHYLPAQNRETGPESSTAGNVLDLETFLADPVSEPVRALWLGETLRGYAAITLLDPGDVAEVAGIVGDDPMVHFIDKEATVEETLGRYRVQAARLVGIAYLAVFLLLIWRYGFLRGTLITLPPITAALTALAIMSALGLGINLFHVLALLLVLGIGIDYTIFFAEGGAKETTMLSIILSAASTALSFGLLGFSATPVLRSLGLTVFFGMVVAWALAPLATRAAKQTRDP